MCAVGRQCCVGWPREGGGGEGGRRMHRAEAAVEAAAAAVAAAALTTASPTPFPASRSCLSPGATQKAGGWLASIEDRGSWAWLEVWA